MTSNAGAGLKKAVVGFAEQDKAERRTTVLETLSQYFKPEFLNRLDAIIEFRPLTKEHLVEIVDVMLDDLRNRLNAQQITLAISQTAKEKLAEMGYHPEFGARPLRRVIQESIEDEITELIIEQESVGEVNVSVDNDQLVVRG